MGLRLAIPLLLLGCLAALALLWLVPGGHPAYLALLDGAGIEPGVIPFLDMHALTSAIQCHHQGIDVYRTNPCDILGRTHSYSPLWLDLMPASLTVHDTNGLGLALDLLFILSLAFILRPRSLAEAGIFALAATSTVVVYALERSNIDLVIFLIIAAAGALQRRQAAMRAAAYALFLLAAGLKYYPAAGLLVAVRERGRAALLALGGATAVLIGFVLVYAHTLPIALTRVPRAKSLFTDSFSARNLPEGVAELLPSLPPAAATVIAATVLLVLLIAATGRVRRLLPLIEAAPIEREGREATYLLVSGTLLVGCFLTSDNIYYRGILFLFALPGLLALRQAAAQPALRRWLTQMVAAILFLMWSECLRRALYALLTATLPQWLVVRLELLFWLAREWLWWWVIAGLAALTIAAVLRSPLFRDVAERFEQWRSAAPSRP